MLARTERGRTGRTSAKDAELTEDEGDLHVQILQECKRRGWLAFHGSMAHRTHRTIGEPDFVILSDGGRLFLVEAKSRKKKPSNEQLAMIAMAKPLGHVIHVVRSFGEFLEAIQ